MAAIQIEGLTRHYGRRRGIEDVSFAVEQGALFGFLGPNGAGKTTTIRVLLGFLRAEAGSARIFELNCWEETKEIKREVGYIPGDLRLPGWMTGATCLSIFSRVRGQDLAGPGGELAERFQLDLQVRVREMSRGMRQKLGLILALVHAPRLLVLDEPTSGLDPLMQEVLRGLLRQRAAEGHTVFFSSHSLAEVEELCDRVAIVRDGRVVVAESLDAFRARAGHEVSIRWRTGQGAALVPPSFLQLSHRADECWRGTVEGPVQPLIDYLAGKPVDDLSIGKPDLESLFRRYYQDDRIVDA